MWVLLKMAQRNLMRNKRRTLITTASVTFASFFALCMSSIQKGTWQNTIEGMLHNYTGYIQIHAAGHQENQSIDLLLPEDSIFQNTIKSIPGVDKTLQRLENYALVSIQDQTKGVLIIGLEPKAANEFSRIEQKIIKGRYLAPNSNDVIVGKDLAQNLHLSLQDTLLGISQGFRGNNAVGKFIVRGIIDFGTPEFNKNLLLTPLDHAQDFFATEDRFSTMVLTTDHISMVPDVAKAIQSTLDTHQIEVFTYQDLIPYIIEVQLLDKASSRIVLFILYILIGFGILGTVMMMLHERNYEFSILKAVGMTSVQLFWMMFFEILFMGIIGLISGSLIALPVLWYLVHFPIELGQQIAEAYAQFNIEPLIKASIEKDIFVEQSFIIFLMVLAISFFPYLKIHQLNPAQGMRQ